VSGGLAIVVTVVVGGLIALQAPVNARLADAVGKLPAAAVSFAIGTVVLVALASVVEGWGRVGGVRDVGPGYLTGGLLGAAYVATALVTVRSLGAGGVTAATIAGQLAAALVVDQFGLLGVEQRGITPLRLAGVLLLALGTALVVEG
jgi:bacterial/archaeal transporter family-2 protein